MKAPLGQGGQGAVKTPNEEVSAEQGADPVGIQGHDKVPGDQAEDQGVEDRHQRREHHLRAPVSPHFTGLAPQASSLHCQPVSAHREIEKQKRRAGQGKESRPIPGEQKTHGQPTLLSMHGLPDPREDLGSSQIQHPEKEKRHGDKGPRRLGNALDGPCPAGARHVQDGHEDHGAECDAGPEEEIDEIGQPRSLRLGP